MLYNEYLSDEDSYIIEEKKEKNKINFKYINFCIITLLLSIISLKGEISPFPYIMIGLASTFSLPLILIYAMSIIGMVIGANTLSSFVLFTLYFAFFSVFTTVVNIEGISRKYVNLIKMVISMLVVKLVAMIFIDISIATILYEVLSASILFIVLVTGIYVVFNIKKSYVFSNEEMIAALVLIALTLTNLKGFTLYNISLMNIAVMALTMIYGWKNSSIMGAVAGLSLGLVVTVLSDFNISFIVTLAFSGMIAGMFKKFGKVAVIVGFILGSIMVSMLLSSSSYIAANMIEILIASTILLFIPKQLSKNLDDIFNYNMKIETANNNLLTGSTDVKSKLNATADMFKDLADITIPITKESKEETREIIKRYILKYTNDNCIGCIHKNKCIDEEKLVVAIDNIANKLEKLDDITEDLLNVKCSKSAQIINDIKGLNDSVKITRLLKKKEEENTKIISKQYKEISNIITNLSKNINNSSTKKSDIDIKNLREELKIVGFRIYEDELNVDKNGYIEYVFLTDILNDIDKQKESILKCLSNITCKPMHIKLILNISKTERSKIKVVSKPDFEIDNITFKGIKDKETVSGDNYVILNDLKNKYISILSDGVGSSSLADSSSKNITTMLEKLLKGGFKEDKAIEIMNNVVNLREAENNFATLDMCVIDLETLIAEFVKLGAAPTYIISGIKISTITNHNVPVGLLDKADYIPITKKLKENDVIIQVSDGIINDEENKIDNYFTAILKKVDTSMSKNDILEYIKKETFKKNGNILKDDSTIMVHKVCKSK